MSKDIVIVNGGTEETWEDISKIKTNQNPSGDIEWVPEDECVTGTITISSNGTYNAENDGLYGYSKATVNVPVPGYVRGTENGTDYIVTVDNNGYLVYTPVEE